MNPKIQKIVNEIEKQKTRISESQNRIRELERQKTELENADIIALFRKEKMSEDEFAAFLRQMTERQSTSNQSESHVWSKSEMMEERNEE